MNEKSKSNCLLYCEPLVHVSQSKPLQCALCGNEFQSEASCTQRHFICNACHSTSVFELIEKVYTQCNSAKSIELAVELMRALSGSTHRPENHLLVPAVLLSIYYNQKGDANEKEKKLKVARQRAENVHGGGTVSMALKTAKKFLEHKIEITLDVPDTVMSEYKEINNECIDYAFPFHKKERI